MRLSSCIFEPLYKQGQYIGRIREYFYYISHEGFLFLDDSRMKNFTAAYRDVDFLNFFYKNLLINESGRYQDSFPYISRCGRERNYLRCDDRPIVFTELLDDDKNLRIGTSTSSVVLQPSELCMLSNGRLYHPAPFGDFGLVKSKLADTLFPKFIFDVDGYPVDMLWKGIKMTNPVVYAPKKSKRPSEVSRDILTGHDQTIIDDDPVDQQTLFCVLDHDAQLTAEDEDNLQVAFQMLESARIFPEWMDARKCLDTASGDENIYVLAAFRGPVLEHLKRLKIKTVSAHLVRHCLHNAFPLPKVNFPIFSTTMKGVVACFTGLDTEERMKLTTLIQYMHGQVSKVFTAEVTHLITDRGDPSSAKYRAAHSLKTPVMSPMWVYDGWDFSLKSELKMDLICPYIMTRYRLPLFSKLVISYSGLPQHDRIEIGRLIELNGGQSPPTLTKNTSTHLLVDKPIGEKYKKAVQWGNVIIVQSRWIRRCVEAGYLLKADRFNPTAPNEAAGLVKTRSSTQTENGRDPVPLELSSILGPTKHTIISQQTDHSELFLNNSNIMGLDKPEMINKTPAAISRTTLLRRESSRRCSNSPAPQQRNSVCDPIDNLSNLVNGGDFDFLEGCIVFVCGAEDRNQDKWKKVLDRCGATRVTTLQCATHIIVVDGSNERSNLLDKKQNGVEVVIPQWMEHCVRDKELLCTNAYSWDPDKSISSTSLLGASTASVSHVSATLTSASDNTLTGVSQRRSNSNFEALAPGLSVAVEGGKGTVSHRRASLKNGNLFRRLTFRIGPGVAADKAAEWKDSIITHSGVVFDDASDKVSDYLLCDLVKYDGLPDMKVFKYKMIISNIWLADCLHQNMLLAPREHALHAPLPALEGWIPFANIVCGLVGFTAHVKAAYTDIIKIMGGSVETSVVSKATKHNKPCTHIIAINNQHTLIPDIRRKLPHVKIVDSSWLIECVLVGSPVSESKYPLKAREMMDYDLRADMLWKNVSPFSTESEEANITMEMSDFGESEVEEVLRDEMGFTDIPVSANVPAKTKILKPMADTQSRINPQLRFDGLTQILDNIPSQQAIHNDSANESMSSINVSSMGRKLAAAAVRMGQPSERRAEPNTSLSYAIPARSHTSPGPTTNSAEEFNAHPVPILMSASMPPVVKDEAYLRGSSQISRKLVKEHLALIASGIPQKSVLSASNNAAPADPQPTGRRAVPKRRRAAVSMEDMDETAPPVKQDKRDSYLDARVEWHESVGSEREVQVIKPIPDAPIVEERQHVFIFTGLSDKECVKMSKMIEVLGGRAITNDRDNVEIAEEVTHLVSGKLLRGMKMMGCIASGRWVVTPFYIQQSYLAKKWLKENDFEFCNPEMVRRYNVPPDGKEMEIAIACRRWRVRLQGTLPDGQPKGAFNGCRFLLYSSVTKGSSLIPILRAGKASGVVLKDPSIMVSDYKPTHVIVCESPEWCTQALNEVVNAGARVFELDFIIKYLLNPRFNEEESLHPDYKSLRN